MDYGPSRRTFLRTSCAVAALTALGAGLTGCSDALMVEPEPPDDNDGGGGGGGDGITISGDVITLDLTGTRARAVATAGGFLYLRGAQTLVVNPNGNEIRAFTSVCTHQGCAINAFVQSRFVCPCHGSTFNTAGGVVQGPATAPLRAFDVARDGDIVTITKT